MIPRIKHKSLQRLSKPTRTPSFGHASPFPYHTSPQKNPALAKWQYCHPLDSHWASASSFIPQDFKLICKLQKASKVLSLIYSILRLEKIGAPLTATGLGSQNIFNLNGSWFLTYIIQKKKYWCFVLSSITLTSVSGWLSTSGPWSAHYSLKRPLWNSKCPHILLDHAEDSSGSGMIQ